MLSRSLSRLTQAQAARQSRIFELSGEAVGEHRHPLWVKSTASLMAAVMYLSPLLVLFDGVAQAAPIVDPRAPVQFQPSMTQTGTGVPAVNIAQPNANGISVNSFQTLNVDASGLVFNNSLVSGTPLLGGTLGANPNLAGRTASTILAQVTSTGTQYRSVLAGPLEIFGSPAALIVSNPNGISVNGLSVTNVSNLTLTTGAVQFLTGAGGTSTDFAHAGALGYSVTSGDISISGPAGANGTPGAGIEGTVGNLDLIGQSVSINAPLYADQRVNVIAGNQSVTPAATGATGTTYTTAPNGALNTSAAIGNGGVAIDASQYGSVTSGQIYIVSTAAGMGARNLGALAATAGNVSVSSNGDITAGSTFANQNVTLASAGSTTITGAGLANQNYTVNAGGDINATAPVSAGQDATLNAGGNLNAASVAANGSANLTAGQSMTIGSLSAHDIALRTTNGDLTVGGLSAPGTVSARAGRDLTVNGAVQGGSTVALASGRNATINGQVSGVGDTTIAAQTGSATVNGNAQSNGALSVTAGQDAAVGGTVQAQGPVTIAAQGGSITGQGNLTSSQGSINLNSGQAIALNGAVQGGSTIDATAGTNANFGGTVSAPGAATIHAGQNTMLAGNVTSGGNLSVTSGGNTSVQGATASIGGTDLVAEGGTLTTTGNVVSLGALNATGQQGVSLGGTVYSGGNAQIGSAAGSVAVAGAMSSPGAISILAGQDASVAGTVQSGQDTTIAAARDVGLNGGLAVSNTGNASVTAGRDINGTGAISVANDTTLNAGNNIVVSGAVQTGNNLRATAAQNLSVGATTAVGTETLTATKGSAMLAGAALSGGAMNVTAGTDVTAQGSVTSLGNLNLNAQGGNLATAGAVQTAGTATLNAGQNLTLGGQTTVSQDATLSGANITTQGLAVGGNLAATAQNSVDTSAGQLNAAFGSSAPALSVNGNATLKGANVTTANAVIGGTYSATGTTGVTTGGTAAYEGDATLTGGTVTNVGQQMAAGNLLVSGSTVTNQGALSSLTAMAINATDLNNSGSIYGPVNTLNVANGTVNSGALLATSTLTLTSGALDNSNGLIFAGDVNHPTATVGDTRVTVNGGNGSFNNTAGQILAQNNLTVNLPNQAIDPSAATTGTLNGGSAFNLSAQSVNNTGAWTLPGTAVTVTASQGINNSGTINQGAGTLALNGAVSNAGTLTANDLTINGSLANQANATVQANNTLTLNGSGTNAGTVEAANALNISGASYDNSNGITKAGNSSSPAGSGNLNISLTGDLGNAGGTLTATNDLAITANNVINSGASGAATTTTTTTTVANTALALALTVGTDIIDMASHYGTGSDGLCCVVGSFTNSVTLADALSVDGVADATSINSSFAARRFLWGKLTGSAPVTTGNTATFVEVPVTTVDAQGNPVTQNLWFVKTADNAAAAIATVTVDLPSAIETTTTTGGTTTASSVIAAGHNVTITAGSLNNQGGTLSAGNDATLKLQSLNNGGSNYSSTVTDTVDVASISSFLKQAPAVISIWSTATGGSSVCPNVQGACIDPSGIKLASPGTVTPLSTSSSVTVQGSTGQIAAGHDLNLSGGNLTNAGTLAAGNDVNITAASFTNQGTNTGTKTVTAGCASGFTGCTTSTTTNPNSETYSYQQINSTVTAGHDIVIAAGTVNNTYGDLAATHDVVIGGAGTTAVSPTQAASVTNTSGAIAAGNDVQINAATITNTIAAPVQIHQNYGTATPYAGCTNNCEAYVDVQSGSPSTITANRNVTLGAGSFSNTGSLVTALNNVTINATNAASSDNQYLSAYWASNLMHYTTSYPAWGCASNPALCQQLYGSAYSSGATQDPAGLPSSVGLPDFVPGTIQAGNTLSVNSPTLTNTGNVIGQTVTLSGSQLVNGITSPNVYTPPPAISGQVISLGPPAVSASATTTINDAGRVTTLGGQPVSVTGAAGLPANTPIGVQTVGKPVAPTVATAGSPSTSSVQTLAGASKNATYLINNPASQVTGGLSPQALLNALPANLQPGSVPFYYDPYTENQQIEQAALQATGKSSFYSTTGATDSTSQASIGNQDKAALYGAALEYAEQQNVALGTQLSAAQLAQVNTPMLWYTEQSVPEPGCTVTGNGACPTVRALMPEVLLPQNFAQVNADGTITGNDVTLNYANSILNTGSVSAQNLTVNTASLTNEQRSTNIGTIYQNVEGGVAVTTGTVLQQGGFMSAMNYDMNAQTINQIGGALQQVGADGGVDQAATTQLLANLKNQLGGNFTRSSVSDHLNTSIISDGGMGPIIVVQMVMLVAISVMTAGAGTGASMAVAAGATAGSATAAAANAAFAALVSSLASQTMNGQFSFKGILESVAIAAITAGLTSGITVDSNTGSLGFSMTQNVSSLPAGVSTLGQLAGAAPGAGTSVAQSAASMAGNLPQQALAIGVEATLQAGVQTALGDGSFLTNLRNDAISDVAAAGAYDIGTAFDGSSALLSTSSPLYWAAHAALGCAAGAAGGTGCAGGAIGGAVSAGLNPLIDSNGNLPPAVLAAITTGVSGGIAEALGYNVNGAVTAAQNETLNNWLNHVTVLPGQKSETQQLTEALAGCDGGNAAACATAGTLMQKSTSRDQALATACQSPGSAACAYQKSLAYLAGNTIRPAGGTTVAVETPSPASTGPGQAAATLDNMLGSPLAGIFGGLMYATGASATDAYYASVIGLATEGIAAGAAGFAMPAAPRNGSLASTSRATNAIEPPPNTYAVYPLGAGAASGPLPPGYVTVSRWVSPAEASLWVQNQGTAIPSAVPQNGTPQVYVTTAGAPYPPGANGTVRIDFAVPSAMLQPGNASNNFQILQPSTSTPIYNVAINVPNGVILPKTK
ncbi:two-partner secretion domain-containing protein [Paraburkholderia terricola]|uniref:two-partner secretion domain-containing protein n=1 Tax=Paraburkholderia terricola TaxID=169427 RepID=UPI0035B546B1